MEKFLRFADLQASGIIASWPMLRRRIERDGFPVGVKVGPNIRAWRESEVDAWIANRPTAKKPAPRRTKAVEASTATP
jgi:predicted DNA-binding transcriptional regulator AlpA